MIAPLEARIANLTSWFNRRNSRPLLGFYIGSQYPLHRYPGSQKHLPDGVVSPGDVVVADYLEDTERLFQTYEEYGGDLVYDASPFFGLPYVEASLGCTVIADHHAGSTHTQPPTGFSENHVIPAFDPDNPWVRKMVEFIPPLVELSNGRYPVGVTLMRGISDLLSALYGGTEFIMQMYEAPEEMARVVGELTDYWIAFGKHLLSHVPSFHGGTGSFFYSVWTPGRTIWLQEDAAALLSPDLYEQFILPCDRKIADAFEHSVMHLHPARFVPVSYLVNTNISVIELHIDQGGPTAEQLYPTHTLALEHKPLVVWGDITKDDFEFMLDHLPAKGLLINVAVSSIEEARWFQDRLADNYPMED